MAFETSRRKVARAEEHITELGRQIHTFFEGNENRMVVEPHPERAEWLVQKLRFSKPIPDFLCSLAIEAVHNLRSSLDNACYELAVKAGALRPKFTAFPFSGSSDEFENSLAGRCRDIPASIYPLFRACKPYRGGNDALWTLNQIAIADKHKLLGIGIDSQLGSIAGHGGLVKIPLRPRWDCSKNEIELGIFAAGVETHFEMEIATFITFDEIECFGDEPALGLLEYFANITTDILAAMEAEGQRLGIIKP